MNKPSRWSYSSLSTYQECPQKWKLSYIDNLPWPTSPAAARGTRLHSFAEGYVLGAMGVVPPDLWRVAGHLNNFKSKNAKTEAVWMLDLNWEPTEDQDKAWIKAIVDVHYVEDDVLHLTDYKSGKPYPTHRNQLELYSIVGMLTYPHVKRVESNALYLDMGLFGAENSVIRAMLPKLKERWHADAVRMYEDEKYEPNPGNACKWCPYSVKKGGPCLAGM